MTLRRAASHVHSTRFVQCKDILKLALQARDEDDRTIAASIARAMLRAWARDEVVKVDGVTFVLGDGAKKYLKRLFKTVDFPA